MAEMLIDGTKLNACLDAEADAIRAKTGGSADIPFDFANNKGFSDAIDSIQTGGGGGMTVLADYTASEDVSAIQIDFTSAMRGYACYMVVLEGAFNRNEYPCPAVNDEPSTSSYMDLFPANTIVKRAFYMLNFNLDNAEWVLDVKAAINTSARKLFSAPISYVKVAAYYADGLFKTGFNVKVYGGAAS